MTLKGRRKLQKNDGLRNFQPKKFPTELCCHCGKKNGCVFVPFIQISEKISSHAHAVPVVYSYHKKDKDWAFIIEIRAKYRTCMTLNDFLLLLPPLPFWPSSDLLSVPT